MSSVRRHFWTLVARVSRRRLLADEVRHELAPCRRRRTAGSGRRTAAVRSARPCGRSPRSARGSACLISAVLIARSSVLRLALAERARRCRRPRAARPRVRHRLADVRGESRSARRGRPGRREAAGDAARGQPLAMRESLRTTSAPIVTPIASQKSRRIDARLRAAGAPVAASLARTASASRRCADRLAHAVAERRHLDQRAAEGAATPPTSAPPRSW